MWQAERIDWGLIDPPLLWLIAGRPLSFMAKAELFRVPLLGALIRAFGAYPVRRGSSDRTAIRIATDRLKQGWAVGVFLDGTRQQDGRVHKPKHGAAMLASRSEVPLLPVAIINSHRALGAGQRGLRLVPIHVRIGELVPYPRSRRRSDLEVTSRHCKDQINQMLDQGPIKRAELRAARMGKSPAPSASDHGR